ncbi:hypothetical protein AB0B45_02705 [Nonomuraea sp. NPDC049152]|uniref:hypothetical protein n=1 Tax=Nonomuraea sp. NPDC049152 TaxID=3154350 RepID=UPI0033E3B2AB
MITPVDVTFLAWALSVAYSAPRILKRWSLITTCDPLELCDSCRDERRAVMNEADEWEILGPVGGVLMVMLTAFGWYLTPLLPIVRKVTGRKPLPKCSKGSCLSHMRGRAAA